jgi:hypothetical protein
MTKPRPSTIEISGRLCDPALDLTPSVFSWRRMRDITVRVAQGDRTVGLREITDDRGRFSLLVRADLGPCQLIVTKTRRTGPELPLQQTPVLLSIGSNDVILGDIPVLATPDVIAGYNTDPAIGLPILDDGPRGGLVQPDVSEEWDEEFLNRVVANEQQLWLYKFVNPLLLPALGGLLALGRAAFFSANARSTARVQHAFDKRVQHLRHAPPRDPDFTDASVVDAILNGLHPMALEPIGEGVFTVGFCWDHVAQHVKEGHWMPNTQAILTTRDGTLQLTNLRIGSHNYTPELRGWKTARRRFMSQYVLEGELDTHFGRGHLMIEAYAMATFRNLRRSPVLRLLAPHIVEVSAINRYGQLLISGPEGVFVKAGPLTWEGVLSHLKYRLAQNTWRGFEATTLPAYTTDHHYPRALNTFRGIVSDYVESYFTQHTEAITQTWDEIEAMDADLGRFEVTSGLSGVETLADLQALCVHVLVHAIFVHTWSNDRQYAHGGNLKETPFSVDKKGRTPSLELLIFQAFIASTLSSTRAGMLRDLAGEEPYSDLYSKLKRERKHLAEWGIPLDKIRQGVNT